jgi:CheY-like chemotaxis protein
MRVLVVEDERKLAKVLASALEAEHYEVTSAANGETGSFGPVPSYSTWSSSTSCCRVAAGSKS